MILRIFHGCVPPGREGEMHVFLRDEAAAHVARVPGLTSFQPGIRATPRGTELVIVTTWTRFEALTDPGPDLTTANTIPRAEDLITAGSPEHYELVVAGSRHLPLRGGRLRITRGLVAPNNESAYFVRVRDVAARLLDDVRIGAAYVGRRTGEGGTEAAIVTIWTDVAALELATGPDLSAPVAGAESLRDYTGPRDVQHFEAVVRIEGGDTAPALLLADDDRRFVHVTQEAAALTGHTIADLLSMRVEDLTAPDLRPSVPALWAELLNKGRMDGPFALARPDGTAVPVYFSARAAWPWPGVHTSVLVPAQAAQTVNIDRALLEAGILSRHLAVL